MCMMAPCNHNSPQLPHVFVWSFKKAATYILLTKVNNSLETLKTLKETVFAV